MAPWVWPSTISGLMQRPTVVDRNVMRDRKLAGVAVDLDLADGAAIWEHRIVHLVVSHDREAVLEIVGEFVAHASCANSSMSKLRLVSGETKRPSANAILSDDSPRTTAAMRRPLSINSCGGLGDTVARGASSAE